MISPYIEHYPGQFIRWTRIKRKGAVTYYAYDPVSGLYLETWRTRSNKWVCQINNIIYKVVETSGGAKKYLINTAREITVEGEKEGVNRG